MSLIPGGAKTARIEVFWPDSVRYRYLSTLQLDIVNPGGPTEGCPRTVTRFEGAAYNHEAELWLVLQSGSGSFKYHLALSYVCDLGKVGQQFELVSPSWFFFLGEGLPGIEPKDTH